MVNMLNHNILLPDWKETMEYLENVFNQATFFRDTRDISAFILPDIGFRFPVGPQLKKNKIETPALGILSNTFNICVSTCIRFVPGSMSRKTVLVTVTAKLETKQHEAPATL